MSTWAVLATGPSMSQAVADSVRGHCAVVAVSDAFLLAPWADALASNDRTWWDYHADAVRFAGRRFSANDVPGVERLQAGGLVQPGSSSGLLALEVARHLGATRILLLGFDMQGSHYFGPHPEPLKNTTPARFAVFQAQFRQWGRSQPRIPVINCTPNSALQCFPHSTLEAELC